MRVCNLSSGSEGNITYIETESAKILVDCGLSCQEVVKRLGLLKIMPEQIDAIIISHEHSDHIRGIEIFAKKYGTKIYAHDTNWKVLESKFIRINPVQFIHFTDNDFQIKDLTIQVIELPHDAIRCSGFTFQENLKKVSIITDLGHTNSQILEKVKDSRLIYIEANHDVELLMKNVKYSASLKHRILSSRGHLSNIACAKALVSILDDSEKQIMLAHLSKENNTPEIAYQTICQILFDNGFDVGGKIKVGVATTNPSSIFKII